MYIFISLLLKDFCICFNVGFKLIFIKRSQEMTMRKYKMGDFKIKH